MKIGILTYYGVHNHGAVLQANALKTVINEMGHDVEFLTFNRNYDYIPVGREKKYNLGLSSIPFYIKHLSERGLGNVAYNVCKRSKLSAYRKSNIPMGDRYSDYNGDIVVIGSDEVFSLEIGINPFFYGHGLKSGKILSYAGCFGPTNIEYIEKNNLFNLLRSGFEGMSAISVRDINSQNIVAKVVNKKATLVCDPVILYGYKQEMHEFVPKIKDYILVYAYDKNMNDKGEVTAIKKYAKAKNLKVISVGYHHKWCDKNINVSPNELLGYIKNASLVVTDTFHGSVMSIICNTPMVVKLRGNSNKLKNLMEEYDLLDRIAENLTEVGTVADSNVDFDKVNAIIEQRRKASLEFLADAINK